MHPTYVASNEVTLLTSACLYGVYRACAETVNVSRGTSYVTTRQHCKYTISADIETRSKRRQSLIENRMKQERGEPTRVQRIALTVDRTVS